MEYRHLGKVIGTLESGVLSKKGKQAVLFRTFNGFGFSRKLLLDSAIDQIEVHYEGKIYKTVPSEFFYHGAYYDDKGDGQLVLPLKWWAVSDPRQPVLL